MCRVKFFGTQNFDQEYDMSYEKLTSRADPMYQSIVDRNMHKKGYTRAYGEMMLILAELKREHQQQQRQGSGVRPVTRSMARRERD